MSMQRIHITTARIVIRIGRMQRLSHLVQQACLTIEHEFAILMEMGKLVSKSFEIGVDIYKKDN